MPELPEVETVRRGLAPHIEGRRIAALELNRADLRFPFPENFAAKMQGATLTHFGRRAKYLLASLEKHGETFYWLSHLGMTGRFMLDRPDAARLEPGDYAHEVAAPVAAKHIHMRLHFEDGTHLSYADPRRFGFMDCFSGAPQDNKFLSNLGPEPLGNQFDLPVLLNACAARKSPIKNVLLDQSVVAGLGNIYVCEALFDARISPRRLAANTGPKRLARLLPAIRQVLQRAIAAGGSSLRDFADSDGKLGYFQHQFWVYDREGAPCSRPDCDATIRRIVQAGRSSFYCPSCQK
ncbi:MAG: bifunctional DNA-formamidopyrimidine glycosylase/DNA-(apurinic or apyrimidinic site) lyase [Parvibaculales bacterium]